MSLLVRIVTVGKSYRVSYDKTPGYPDAIFPQVTESKSSGEDFWKITKHQLPVSTVRGLYCRPSYGYNCCFIKKARVFATAMPFASILV